MVDPISNLISVGTSIEVRAMLARLIDFMKVRSMTALFTSLTFDEAHPEGTDIGISSFMDTWLRAPEHRGERGAEPHARCAEVTGHAALESGA